MVHVPQFDGVDYLNPSAYAGVRASFAGRQSIETLATTLCGPTSEATLGNVWRWIRDNLHAETEQGDYRWRTASEIVERGWYFGCAEHALVYGSIIRACGIPTVWVKTLDVPWIREFATGRPFDGGSGHVYLEVFLSGQWCLLDATHDLLYDTYDPHKRLLPGGHVDRYAYDKGGDARELVLSLDWEPWKEETKRHFSGFDLQELERAGRATQGSGRRLAV
jgi:transglutaminase-like putative cysteine protease